MESQQQQQQEQANRDQQQETEEIEVADRRCGSAQEENHVNRSRSHGSSSPHSSLQSGKLSETLSDPNNFSDDDRGSDAKIEVDDEQQEDGNNGGNGESGNPAANFNQRHSGTWNYNEKYPKIYDIVGENRLFFHIICRDMAYALFCLNASILVDF